MGPSRGLRAEESAGTALAGGPCGLSWGYAALRGLGPEGHEDGHGFRPPRAAFLRPAGDRPSGLPAGRSRGRPPLRFRAPSETCLQGPATPGAAVGRGRPRAHAGIAASPGLPFPTAHPGSADPLRWRRIPPPPRATSEVWLPPSRRSPPNLPAHEAPEHPWASPFKAFSSVASRTPLGVPSLLTLPRPPRPPCGGRGGRPPTGPCSRDELVPSPGRRSAPAVDAFLGFTPPERSPHASGPPLVVAGPALSPSGGLTSRPAWTSGLHGAHGSAWSVSGLPALLGFRTLRPSQHSVRRAGGRAHGFTSRGTSPDGRSQPRS
jgi:hypothetical protein